MDIDRDDRLLVDSLKAHASGGKRPEFPYDCEKFTMECAALRIESLLLEITLKEKEQTNA